MKKLSNRLQKTLEKEIDKFQQETQSNFQKINENIDKLEKMIINQNKSNQESE
ncbi:hypothetical protein HGD80_02585 [Paulownia witches'-broom phytoplasma]|uniref:Uncharacterized protein n=1 Tax=Paulownia witches'-broom phytoplasma TaxID=39647 RepID=A0ABX8TST3_9MOLU|nr:hypothetical protein [Paulownia witches'-broom phytoplasma]QYC31428.1 hypothetical protein HGD80_02585 [Paulownia witches'-broom phytoplasma]GLH60907.1 hypothetical protein PAWBP_6450 [Paulownia witches'-broom phytoplasma]